MTQCLKPDFSKALKHILSFKHMSSPIKTNRTINIFELTDGLCRIRAKCGEIRSF